LKQQELVSTRNCVRKAGWKLIDSKKKKRGLKAAAVETRGKQKAKAWGQGLGGVSDVDK